MRRDLAIRFEAILARLANWDPASDPQDLRDFIVEALIILQKEIG